MSSNKNITPPYHFTHNGVNYSIWYPRISLISLPAFTNKLDLFIGAAKLGEFTYVENRSEASENDWMTPTRCIEYAKSLLDAGYFSKGWK